MCYTHDTESICVFLNIFTYTVVAVLRALACQPSCWATGQIGLLPPAGCPKVEFCVWQAASTIHHHSWIRRITPTRPPGIGINPFCRLVQGLLEMTYFFFFFFFNPNHYFHSQTEGNSCHPEEGEEKDSRALELGHELAWSWNSSQQSTGLGEGMAILRMLRLKIGLMSQNPGFKFPGQIHWVFLRKFLVFKNSFSCRVQVYTSTLVFSAMSSWHIP